MGTRNSHYLAPYAKSLPAASKICGLLNFTITSVKVVALLAVSGTTATIRTGNAAALPKLAAGWATDTPESPVVAEPVPWIKAAFTPTALFVVVVTVEKSDYLDSQATVDAEFSLLKIKYIVRSTPEEDIKKIATDAKISSKIPGLLQFIPRLQTIRKVGEY